MRIKSVSTVIIIVALIPIGVYIVQFLQTGVETPTLSVQPDSTQQITEQKDEEIPFTPLIIGDRDAEVSIIEYADYKCPECGKFHSSTYKQIKDEYIDTGKINIIFRPYPVYSVDGAKALAGSYCAQAQGKFEAYYDLLFSYMWENHFESGDYQKAIDPVLTDDVLAELFTSISIDKTNYDTCLVSPETETAYMDDIFLAAPDEIQGTPSFIIGGQKVVGPQPYSVFKTLLDIQLR